MKGAVSYKNVTDFPLGQALRALAAGSNDSGRFGLSKGWERDADLK